MIERSVVALLHLMNVGYEPVIATRAVAADLRTLRALLSEPANYHGAARVKPTGSARVVVVRVRLAPRRVLRYTWILTADDITTEVDLAAQIESRGIVHRLGLLLGGRRVLQRRLEATLATLPRVIADGAQGSGPNPATGVTWQHAA